MTNKEVMNQSQLNQPELKGTWGLAGMEMLMNVVPFNSKKPKKFLSPGGGKGKYKVSFVLSKPNYAPLDENHISFDIDKINGDSHLFIGNPEDLRIELSAKLPEGDYFFWGFANNKGYLSKIEIEEVEALNFNDAFVKTYNALCPILSRISVLMDIPLNIYNYTIIELSTHNHLSSLSLPYTNKTPPVLNNSPKNKDFEKFASLYREALNSNSPNYQYLCFYKIIEGLRKIREERFKKENQRIILTGKKPIRPKEVIPLDKSEQKQWLSWLFGRQNWSDMVLGQIFSQEVVGRKINDLINPSKKLDMVRNKIAHTILRDESEETFSIDDGLHIQAVHAWLPLCKCLALYLLKKEFPRDF